MILLTKDKTRAKRPGLFLTKKCYPQKYGIHSTTERLRIAVLVVMCYNIANKTRCF